MVARASAMPRHRRVRIASLEAPRVPQTLSSP